MVIQAGQQAVRTAATAASQACWAMSNILSSEPTRLAVCAARTENAIARAEATVIRVHMIIETTQGTGMAARATSAASVAVAAAAAPQVSL